MRPHPCRQIAIWIKPLAISKDLAQTSPGAIRKIGKQHAGRTFAVSKKGEIDWGIRKFRLGSEGFNANAVDQMPRLRIDKLPLPDKDRKEFLDFGGRGVPGLMIALPSASPPEKGPDSEALNKSSSSF